MRVLKFLAGAITVSVAYNLIVSTHSRKAGRLQAEKDFNQTKGE